MSGPAVSVYIPCFNVARFLPRVIAGLKRQSYPIQEIIAVDDGSSDDSAALAAQLGARVVRHERNRGLAAVRNTAVRAATTPYVASVDGDVVAHADWLGQLVATAEGGGYAGVCGQLQETQFFSLGDLWRNVHMRQGWGESRVEQPDFLFGNNNLYRRDALVAVGLYDERFRTNGEDADVSRRLKEAGHRLCYDPAARCDHLRQDSYSAICRTFWRYNNWREPPKSFREFRRHRRWCNRFLRGLAREDWRAGRWLVGAATLGMLLPWWWWDWRQYFTGRRP
jgi:glycosyltransferase involved in cell wall biosynthesis